MADTPKLDPKTERLVRQHATALSVYLDMAVADATQAHLDWRRAARERMERLHPVNEPPDVSLWLALFTQAAGAVGPFSGAYRQRLAQILEAAQQAGEGDVVTLLEAHGESGRRPRRTALPVDVLFAQIDAMVVNVVQRSLAESAQSGATWGQMVAAATAQDGAVARTLSSIVERVHAFVAAAYSGAALDAISANDDPARPLFKRIAEVDDIHNHPISRVLDGQVRRADEPFEASAAAVAVEARVLRRSVGGIFWPLDGDTYKGHRLPAHRHERGIIHAWRSSWTTQEK